MEPPAGTLSEVFEEVGRTPIAAGGRMAYKFLTIVIDPPRQDSTLRPISPLPSPAVLPRYEKPWTSEVG